MIQKFIEWYVECGKERCAGGESDERKPNGEVEVFYRATANKVQ
jgi:hypothetical protein